MRISLSIDEFNQMNFWRNDKRFEKVLFARAWLLNGGMSYIRVIAGISYGSPSIAVEGFNFGRNALGNIQGYDGNGQFGIMTEDGNLVSQLIANALCEISKLKFE